MYRFTKISISNCAEVLTAVQFKRFAKYDLSIVLHYVVVQSKLLSSTLSKKHHLGADRLLQEKFFKTIATLVANFPNFEIRIGNLTSNQSVILYIF